MRFLRSNANSLGLWFSKYNSQHAGLKPMNVFPAVERRAVGKEIIAESLIDTGCHGTNFNSCSDPCSC